MLKPGFRFTGKPLAERTRIQKPEELKRFSEIHESFREKLKGKVALPKASLALVNHGHTCRCQIYIKGDDVIVLAHKSIVTEGNDATLSATFAHEYGHYYTIQADIMRVAVNVICFTILLSLITICFTLLLFSEGTEEDKRQLKILTWLVILLAIMQHTVCRNTIQRAEEYNADAAAIELMKKSGISDPAAELTNMLRSVNCKQWEPKGIGEKVLYFMFASHPTPTQRIDAFD